MDFSHPNHQEQRPILGYTLRLNSSPYASGNLYQLRYHLSWRSTMSESREVSVWKGSSFRYRRSKDVSFSMPAL